MESAMLHSSGEIWRWMSPRSRPAGAQMRGAAAGDQLPLVSSHSGVIHQQDLQARLESPSLWNTATSCCCTTNASSAANLESRRCGDGCDDDDGDGSLPPRQAAPAFHHIQLSLCRLSEDDNLDVGCKSTVSNPCTRFIRDFLFTSTFLLRRACK